MSNHNVFKSREYLNIKSSPDSWWKKERTANKDSWWKEAEKIKRQHEQEKRNA